jgi:hypothetical protein
MNFFVCELRLIWSNMCYDERVDNELDVMNVFTCVFVVCIVMLMMNLML